MFTDEECGNIKVVNSGGERTRNITQKKKSDVLKPLGFHSLTNDVSESIFSITMRNIVNQYGSVVNNLKVRKLFYDQMNRNCYDLKSC